MGTHMWTNPTSRRGRRMSLELPMRPGPNSGQGHPGSSAEQEFMQRRPELFFPYLPPFFNGLPPKVIIRCTFLLLYMLTAKNYLA